MKLTLDHTQRLNLHALLGAQRADVGSIRAIWAVQDKIALDADEEKALELKREVTGGTSGWCGMRISCCLRRSSTSPTQRPLAFGVRSKLGTRTLPVPIGVGCGHSSRRCFRLTSGEARRRDRTRGQSDWCGGSHTPLSSLVTQIAI